MMNTEVGYCQGELNFAYKHGSSLFNLWSLGMSQIAAIFLMYMDEEDAFWCMHSLLVNRKYAMHGNSHSRFFILQALSIFFVHLGFFIPGFPKLQRFQYHYEKVLAKYLPRVKRHFVY
jgi:hypothetical protein